MSRLQCDGWRMSPVKSVGEKKNGKNSLFCRYLVENLFVSLLYFLVAKYYI